MGTVDGTDAYIALLIGGEEGIVYVCNGNEEIYEWFRGPISDPTNIAFKNGVGAEVAAQFTGRSFDGEVTLSSGGTFAFEAAPNTAENGGIFQVYGEEAEQADIKIGWIINSDGDQRGAESDAKKKKVRRPSTLETIQDGTSQTTLLGRMTFPVRRFFVTTAFTDTVPIIAPNNIIAPNS